MENIFSFISSESFKNLVLPLLLGAIVSWYISKHFFFKKSPTLKKLALKHKETGFGSNRNRALETEDEIINHSIFGKLTIKGNGIWVDEKNRLMWIRAPWGMEWNGSNFVGEPQKINWYDASRLFGREENLYASGASLKRSKMIGHEHLKYTKGNCKVNFMDYSDWRLPKVAELDLIGFYTSDSFFSDTENEPYVRSTLQKPTELREKLFPWLKDVTTYYLWSATPLSSSCAWAGDGSWPLGDFKFSDLKYVLFVRTY